MERTEENRTLKPIWLIRHIVFLFQLLEISLIVHPVFKNDWRVKRKKVPQNWKNALTKKTSNNHHKSQSTFRRKQYISQQLLLNPWHYRWFNIPHAARCSSLHKKPSVTKKMHNDVLRVSSVGKFGRAEPIFCPLKFKKKNGKYVSCQEYSCKPENMQKLF